MTNQEFKQLFDTFNPRVKKEVFFESSEWQPIIDDWEVGFYTLIRNGLPINKWLREPNGEYLPNYLDVGEKRFGHARIGNYEQVMIYQYTGTDAKRKNKYRNAYRNTDANATIDTITQEIEDDYNTNIRDLIQALANATTLDDIFALEEDNRYKAFSCKQILRKISVLCSLLSTSSYPHAFTWIYGENTINTLGRILNVDFEENDTFLKKNHKVYEQAKNYAGVTAASSKEDFIKLYCLLWYLSDTTLNSSELTDFYSINVIFNGAPGTGKTYGVLNGIECLQKTNAAIYRDHRYVQFHPSFSYQDFIEGIKPLGIVGGNLNLQVVNGCFKDFCIFVKQQNEQYYQDNYASKNKTLNIDDPTEFDEWPHYYFVVDEINRGNLSNIFGETFTLLEKDYRDYNFTGHYTPGARNLVATPLSNVIATIGNSALIYKQIGNEVLFGIPFNIHFIGIMNDVDKSIDAFDLALRRRFKWIAKYCDYDVITSVLEEAGYQPENVREYVESCKKLNEYICTAQNGLKLGRAYEIGHAFFLKVKNIQGNRKITAAKKKEVFDNYIAGTLKEYIRQIIDEQQIDSKLEDAKKVFGLN